jgi:hypothetical protein
VIALVILGLAFVGGGFLWLWKDHLRVENHEAAIVCGTIGMAAITCAVLLVVATYGWRL